MRKVRIEMSKYVRRIIPFESCDIPAIQKWLEDMAKEGLYYKECGMICASFETGEPVSRRYRVDFCNVVCGKIPEDKQELYEACGWTVAGELKNDLVVLYTDDPEAPEIYSDQRAFIEPLDKIRKKHALYSIAFLVMFLLSPLGYPLQMLIKGSGGWVDYLIDFGTVKFVVSTFAALVLAVEFVIHIRSANHLKKQIATIESGGTMPQNEENRVKKAFGRVFLPLSLPVIIAWFIISFSSTGYTLQNADDLKSYPFPFIAEINEAEGSDMARIDRIQDYSGHADQTHVGRRKNDLLTRTMLQLWQSGDGKIGYYYDHHVFYYELKSEKLAEKMLEGRIEDERDFDGDELKARADKIVEETKKRGGEYEIHYDGSVPIHKLTQIAKPEASVYYVIDHFKTYDEQRLYIQYGNVFEVINYEGKSDLSEYVDLYISYLKK